MAAPVIRTSDAPTAELLAAFAAVRAEQHVPEVFPREVESAAAEAAARAAGADRRDMRDVPFVTIDPPHALDLDQAVALSARSGGGWRVQYAIADVAAFVGAGDPVDSEARVRGVTRYSPDLRTPLHPTVLSERAASLLPDGDRPALVWTIDLDGSGAQVGDAVVERAVVRSRAQLDYPGVQATLATAGPDEVAPLLRAVGQARQAQEVARGGVSLDLAEQEVVFEDGHYRLEYRHPLPVEGWNAQISLLTGIAAAGLMVAAGVGLLRTLPAPEQRTVAAIRRSAVALGLPVSATATYPEIVRAADPSSDRGAALLHQAARGLRGAGYLVINGSSTGSAERHSAIAATYAHVTAPLRRLADRFANEVVLALCADRPVPGWATEALPTLPALMGAANERDSALARAMVDVVEALVLRHRVGDRFDAAVTNVDDRGGVVQLRDPAVLARVEGVHEPDLGQEVVVRLDSVDVATREVRFSRVSPG